MRSSLPFERDSFAGQILLIAASEAARLSHDYLGVEHVLMALTRCEGGHTQRMLERLDLNPGELRDTLRRRAGASNPDTFERQIVATPRLRAILERERAEVGAAGPGERRLLLDVLESGLNLAVRTLILQGVAIEDIIAGVRGDSGADAAAPSIDRLAHGRGHRDPLEPEAPHSSRTTILERYGRDLSALARQGKLRPVVPRGAYFAEIARALARHDRNAPVLVGEAGVGKTAIVEGLAQRLALEAQRPVAAPLRGKRIIELRPSDLVAGASARGDFEERMRDVLRECAEHPEIILFIDEIHTLIGAGHHAGNQDAAQLIKPALERGELRLIGATTPDEYQRYIADDAALERRFQVIRVEEPSPSDAEDLLRAALPDIEARANASIQPDALVSAIELSVRYIHDERLPGKAISVLFDACSRALVPEDRISMLGDLDINGQPSGAHPTVTPDLVEKAVSARVGFPIGQTETHMRERLQELQDKLRQRVIGQEDAITAVAQTLRVAYSVVRNPDRPKAVFLFTGPSGVGKTETARALAETLFGDAAPQQMLILDMAEFSEKHMFAQLVGSPPGYVNSDDQGRLTGWLRLHPFGIVLLDEIEKAHAQVRQALLGLFETGRITDARGRAVNGREAIYIMTSNLLATSTPPASDNQDGAANIADRDATSGAGGEGAALSQINASLDASVVEELVRQRLTTTLSPEFVGRIDRIVMYQPLNQESLRLIVQLMLDRVRDLLRPEGVGLDVSADVYDWLIQRGVSPQTGARDLDRLIRSAILASIADLQFRHRLPPGATARVVMDGPHPRVTT